MAFTPDDDLTTLLDVTTSVEDVTTGSNQSFFGPNITTSNLTTPSLTPSTIKAVPPTVEVLTDIAEFEVILPCIFGVFMILSLSLIVFYTREEEDEDKHAILADEGRVPTDAPPAYDAPSSAVYQLSGYSVNKYVSAFDRNEDIWNRHSKMFEDIREKSAFDY